MFLVDVIENDLYEEKKKIEEIKEQHECRCGRRVCCGKHKNSQCTYSKKGQERD